MPILFSDGQVGSTMETAGNFTAWSGSWVDATHTLTVETTQKHHGVNSAYYSLAALANGTYDYLYFNTTLVNTLSTRIYLYITEAPSNGKTVDVMCFGTGVDAVAIGIINDSGNLKLFTAGSWNWARTACTTILSLNTWYSVELLSNNTE
jgi:hypothetical protein